MTKLLISSDVAFSRVRKVVLGFFVMLILTFPSLMSLFCRESSAVLFKTLVRLQEAAPILNGTKEKQSILCKEHTVKICMPQYV